MHEIPFDAKVICSDSRCGTVVAVTLHPTSRIISNLIVEDEKGRQRIVPRALIAQTGDDEIKLTCSEAELQALDLFQTTEFVNRAPQQSGDWTDEEGEWEDSVDVSQFERQTPGMPVEVERVPPGEIAFHRKTDIEASDDYVGEVNRLLVDEKSGKITHLVSNQGHLWHKRSVMIPLTAVDSLDYDSVYLNVTKKEVEDYPTLND
ncbi:MAG: PRC-barrel domain-containing protein [Candidatus Promineifilaceae bacterium]